MREKGEDTGDLVMKADLELKQLIKTRWDKRARTYDLSPGHGIHSTVEKQAWLRLLKEALPDKKLNILDVGTGTGALSLMLAELGHQVMGLDLAENMLALARQKAARRQLAVRFQTGDAEDPSFESESLDAIVSRHLLWLLPNPEKALGNWKRLLKPGGVIVIIDGPGANHRRKVIQELWRYLAMPLVLITEFRDPRLQNKDIQPHLPMRQRNRPEAELKLLGDLGFRVDVTNVTLPRTYSAMNYLKYGYAGANKHQFVVRGVKPE